MTTDEKKYLAYLRVRRIDTREIVHSIGVSHLDEQYVDCVMMGLLMNMDTEHFIADDSEVDAAREKAAQ